MEAGFVSASASNRSSESGQDIKNAIHLGSTIGGIADTILLVIQPLDTSVDAHVDVELVTIP